MAMLIIAIGVMTVLWTAALPTWSQFVQREKEEELIFRGEQYARAIRLFQQRYANAFPPNVEVLIDQRFLRQEYKDPMVEDGEFELLYLTSQVTESSESSQNEPIGRPSQFAAAQTESGGIVGVVSKSTDTSIREYKGATHYNEWRFVPLEATTQPGGPGGVPGPEGLTPPGPVRGGGRGNTLFGGRGADRPNGGPQGGRGRGTAPSGRGRGEQGR